MDLDALPQEGNATLAGHRKAMYARAADGRIVLAPSRGWEVEEIVTTQAVDAMVALAQGARQRVQQGTAAPLEYWMYACRMDVALLAQTSGTWQWQVRRHLRPATFARLSARQLQRYATALGMTAEAIRRMP
jgi:hypothetical protein